MKTKKSNLKKKQIESESEAFFSSSEEKEVEINKKYYEEFVSHEDLQEEVEAIKEELSAEILEQARQMFISQTGELIDS